MFRYHLLIAFRTLSRQRLFAGISIFGLAVAIASCLLMGLYIRNEFRYDRFHPDHEDIYRVVFDRYLGMEAYATTPLPVGPALEKDFPEISAMTRIAPGLESLVRYGDNRYFETVTFADSGLARVFDLDVVAGDVFQALTEPNRVILSESTARKYFGDADPIGKILEIGSSGKLNSEVAAVFRDWPEYSHIDFDVVLPFRTFYKVYEVPDLWRQMPRNFTYLKLEAEADQLAEKLPGFAKRYVGEELEDWQLNYQLSLQPLGDIHFHSRLQREFEPNGQISTVLLLMGIALVVLLIACVNYINFATSRFHKRAREVGIRKIIGAARRQLVRQFMGEAVIIALSAGLLSLIFGELLLPVINRITGQSFQFHDLLSLWPLHLSVLVAVSLVSGFYPAFFLSGFRPVEAMKGRFTAPGFSGHGRRGLVVGQFAVSILLVLATLVVYQQMELIRKKMLVGEGDQVMVFQLSGKLADRFELFKERLLKQPGVVSISAGSSVPGFGHDSWPLMRDRNSEPVQTENYAIEEDYLNTLGLELVAGRHLSGPNSAVHEFLITQTAVRQLGFTEAEEAIGKTLYWGGDEKVSGVVAGVVKDFHFESLHERIAPAVMQFAPFEWMDYVYAAVRVDPEQVTAIREAISREVALIDPSWVADLRFMSDRFAQMHRKDQRQGQLFGAFAILAILISCLGLFGLAAFSAEQRTKEMGVRKVLGADFLNIWSVFTREFIYLTFLGVLFSFPAGWYFMNKWLQDFVYRIDLSWGLFALAGLSAMAIALLTVSYHAIRVAGSNPVDSLKDE